MEEIKVGEYMRIKSGVIGKVVQIEIAGQGTRHYNESFEDTIYCIDTNDYIENYRYKIQAIVKHSPNIIDLIEVGDYVNGELVTSVYDENKEDEQIQFEVNNQGNYTYYINEDIKSIVTKEQFKSIEYRLED